MNIQKKQYILWLKSGEVVVGVVVGVPNSKVPGTDLEGGLISGVVDSILWSSSSSSSI